MPNDNRVFPAGTGGNPTAPQIGTVDSLLTTAQPPIRPPPDPFVLKSVEPFTDDDNIPGFVDGQGNRIWHVDTSASAKAIIFASAGETVDFDFTVKWVKGANGFKITEVGGANVGGTLTFVGVVAGDAYQFRSDGTEYHLVGQATNQSYVTSNSLSAALAAINFTGSQSFAALTVLGSSTFSGTAVFSTSLAVSGTASVGTLVVSGTSTFSGQVVFNAPTVSFTAMPTVGGLPLSGWQKIGSASLSNVTAITFSGSWTAYSALRVEAAYRTVNAPNAELRLSSDNGSTYLLAGNAKRMPGNLVNILFKHSASPCVSFTVTITISGADVVNTEMKALGINPTPGTKYISGAYLAHGGSYKASAQAAIAGGATAPVNRIVENYEGPFESALATATANSAQVNQISFAARNKGGTTVTMSSGVIYLYGLV